MDIQPSAIHTAKPNGHRGHNSPELRYQGCVALKWLKFDQPGWWELGNHVFLPDTIIFAPKSGWKMIVSFGMAMIFRGYVSFREGSSMFSFCLQHLL